MQGVKYLNSSSPVERGKGLARFALLGIGLSAMAKGIATAGLTDNASGVIISSAVSNSGGISLVAVETATLTAKNMIVGAVEAITGGICLFAKKHGDYVFPDPDRMLDEMLDVAKNMDYKRALKRQHAAKKLPPLEKEGPYVPDEAERPPLPSTK